jgi:peptidoglycan/LPS O-acetylase OafA/YrhL
MVIFAQRLCACIQGGRMGKLENASGRANQRLAGLDLLRLLAVLLTLGRHLTQSPDGWPGAWDAILSTWYRGGWVGVDLFFVLSGFLVSGLLFSEYKTRGQFSLARFYTRRGWKIYPPFFVLTGVTVGVILIRGQPLPPLGCLADVFFFQSYHPGLWGHSWSLAVEEHFYLLLPLGLLLILKLNRSSAAPLRPILVLAGCVAAGALCLRVINWCIRPEYSPLTHHFATHLRFDSLLFGVAISYLYHFHNTRFVELFTPWRRWLIAGGVLLLTPAFALPVETTPFIFTAGFTIFSLGSGMLLVGVLLSAPPRNRFARWGAGLGAYSYSIYLWHPPLIYWGIPSLEHMLGTPLGFGMREAVYLGGSLAVGVMMAKLVEIPALRLRDRWFPSRSATPGNISAAGFGWRQYARPETTTSHRGEIGDCRPLRAG